MGDYYNSPRSEWYPKAIIQPVRNHGVPGSLPASRVRFIVEHIAQGTSPSGVYATFNNPAAQRSAHFFIDKFGTVFQFVALDTMAWHVENYNDVAIGVEHAGYSGQKLNRYQLRASLALNAWLHDKFPAVPLRRTANPSGHGVIGHGELGVAGGDHPSCPGSPILSQFDNAYRVTTVAARVSKENTVSAPTAPIINIPAPLKKFVNEVEGFAAHAGSWVIIINDFVHAFKVSNTGSLSSILTALAGSVIVGTHVVKKVKTPAPPAA